MKDDPARFDTRVAGTWGRWPSAPSVWSYSSLKELESCPRRWMLSRAAYPDVWNRNGYPAVPVVAADFGVIVHQTVERLAKAFKEAGIGSPKGADAVSLLRSMGGLKGVVGEAIEEHLATYDGNPRATPERLDRAHHELTRRIDEASDLVKGFLGRGALPVSVKKKSQAIMQGSASSSRPPAGPGLHTERSVVSEELRMTGIIDLLTIDNNDVVITDFKTGAEDPSHQDQVRIYALLWDLDRQSNPLRRPTTRLRVSYSARQVDFPVPDEVSLRELQAATAQRIAAADAMTRVLPPAAVPSQDNCRFCHVKHLCDAYWPAVPPRVDDASPQAWFDFEGRVIRNNGKMSWLLRTEIEGQNDVLVRTSAASIAFPIGQRVRIMGVRRSEDPDDDQRLVISMSKTSEWFALVDDE